MYCGMCGLMSLPKNQQNSVKLKSTRLDPASAYPLHRRLLARYPLFALLLVPSLSSNLREFSFDSDRRCCFYQSAAEISARVGRSSCAPVNYSSFLKVLLTLVTNEIKLLQTNVYFVNTLLKFSCRNENEMHAGCEAFKVFNCKWCLVDFG